MGGATSSWSGRVTHGVSASWARGSSEGKAGLHPTTVLYLAERAIAVLGSDGNGDTAPSTTEGIGFPIHALTLNAMGLP